MIVKVLPAASVSAETVIVLPAFLQNATFPTYEAGNGALFPNPGYACLPTAVTGVTNIVTAGGMLLTAALAFAGAAVGAVWISDREARAAHPRAEAIAPSG